MTKEDVSVTYENNIFHCTVDNIKWISVDGENWYGEERRIKELEQENTQLKEQNSHLYNDLTMTEAENTDQKDQLTKATEIIRRLMDIIKHDLKCFDTIAGLDVKQKAEQFLKEIEK